MKIDKEYRLGIISIIISTISLYLWQISYFASREAEISRKISSSLNLLPNCGFDSVKIKYVGDTLLQAQKAIDVDGNYDAAASLFNSLSGELYACKPLLQANPDLMLITILILILIIGVITIIRHFNEKHKGKLEVKLKKFLNSKFSKKMQILFLTPLLTTILLPLIFIFFIPLLFLRLSEFGFDLDVFTFITNSIIVVTILNGLSLYYLKHSPSDALTKFKENQYILNYTVMKYAFPIQLGFFITIIVVLNYLSIISPDITPDQTTFLFSLMLYFIMAVSISIVFFITTKLNSQYRYIMAKANCILFSNAKNDSSKLKYIISTIKYYNEFLRENFKISLNIKINIITAFLTNSEIKNKFYEKFLNTFEEGETKPLEFLLNELKISHEDLLQAPSKRDIIAVWSPLLIGIFTVIFAVVQVFLSIYPLYK